MPTAEDKEGCSSESFQNRAERFLTAPIACLVALVGLLVFSRFAINDWMVASAITIAIDTPFQLMLSLPQLNRFRLVLPMFAMANRTFMFGMAWVIIGKPGGATNWLGDNLLLDSLLGCYFSLLVLESRSLIRHIRSSDVNNTFS